MPFGLLLPILGVLSCGALIAFLPAHTHLRFIGWLALGAVIYFAYGVRHSKLNKIDPLIIGKELAILIAVIAILSGIFALITNTYGIVGASICFIPISIIAGSLIISHSVKSIKK